MITIEYNPTRGMLDFTQTNGTKEATTRLARFRYDRLPLPVRLLFNLLEGDFENGWKATGDLATAMEHAVFH